VPRDRHTLVCSNALLDGIRLSLRLERHFHGICTANIFEPRSFENRTAHGRGVYSKVVIASALSLLSSPLKQQRVDALASQFLYDGTAM